MMAGREGGETGEPGGMLAGVGFGGEVVRVLPLAQLFWRGGGDRGVRGEVEGWVQA